jgi:hypothetical protein
MNIVRAAMRPIAVKAASDALANVGVAEEGNNAGKAVETYLASCVPPLGPGAPWCAAFVRYRMKAAATKLGLTYDTSFPRSAYTPDWANWGRRNGKWIPVSELYDGMVGDNPVRQVILPGDLALFYFSQLGRIGHIGIITSVRKTGLMTVEGNTSPEPEDASEVERDGDGVFRKNRGWTELGKFGGILLVDF